MTALASCPRCGSPLAAKSPQGLCPACLLKAGLESRSASEPPSAATPSDFDPGLAMTIEHVHSTNDDFIQQFEELKMRLGMETDY